MSEKGNESSSVLVTASINHICDELKLVAIVRTKCIEVCTMIMPKQVASITKTLANSIACAIVSIVHEESRRGGRVDRHLPDRIIGSVFKFNAGSIVYNKRIVNHVIAGDDAKLAGMITT
ncbi:MAG TPA: hypothetical protein VGQ03_08550 [Nitrososphaera sp.]|jgi:hypothetical protein|nr:hypothetical protein [Nitrososphaera sp.]